MASLIPDYEYDIFISYRQKDNKGGRQGAPSFGATQSREAGWVSEFVEALKTELESTFKEEISVYFDINPHDGLLETHDVDASLKEKLKCLVFIPVLSRTYCDPKSFAWENEFKAFAEQASKDQFGLKVKLSNGNIANRIFPVRIHDLDADDIRLCESVTGGVLHEIEFIYRSTGVNRPLRPKEDNPHENMNKTFYRDQINKTVLAIKEIILGLKGEPDMSMAENSAHREQELEFYEVKKPTKLKRNKFFVGAGILTIIVIAGIFAFPRLTGRQNLERLISKDGKIPIAIMPFQNMTNDTLWNVWQDGIQNILITSLSNSEEFKVRQLETVTNILKSKGLTDYASLTPSVASSISRKLETNVNITGSIKQSGSTIRVNAQLVDTKKGEAFKSFQIDGTADSILPVIDSLSFKIKNFLIISVLRKKISIYLRELESAKFGSTNSPEAYRYFVYGQNAFVKGDFPSAVKFYLQSIAIDTNFFIPYVGIVPSYLNQGMHDQAKKWALKTYEKRDQMTIMARLYAIDGYAMMFGTLNDCVNAAKQILEVDDQDAVEHYYLGLVYEDLFQYDKAIPEFEKALEIYKKWGSKPMWVDFYCELGKSYHKTGQYKKERKMYKKAKRDFPDDWDSYYGQARLSLTKGDSISANRYIEKIKLICKDKSMSEADIMYWLARLYDDEGLLDKAEKYNRQSLSLAPEPEIPGRLNLLAMFLIDKDRNIDEGLKLADRALELSPDNYGSLHVKGWGLYKQGKYKEALDLLEESWNLRMKKSRYYHPAYLHLEAAKKAVAGLK